MSCSQLAKRKLVLLLGMNIHLMPKIYEPETVCIVFNCQLSIVDNFQVPN